MNKSDHLDNNVAISAQLVERGLQLKAQSRAISGIDRLVGNLSELVNAPLERSNARIRAEQSLIEALGEAAVTLIKEDADLAKQILEKKVHRVAQEFFNKEAVVAAAIEDLSSRPPSPEMAASGPEVLDRSFLNRFERYAEAAEDDVAQEKWARVLAGEIRQPGRFTLKTMRLIDEISTDAAKIFHDLCKNRIGDCIPKYLCGDLNFKDKSILENAGLLVPSEGETVRLFNKLKNSRGDEMWLGNFGGRTVGFSTGTQIPKGKFGIDLSLNGSELGCPIYLLTADGEVIASLADDSQSLAWKNVISKIAKFLVGIEVHEFAQRGDKWALVATHCEAGPKAAGA